MKILSLYTYLNLCSIFHGLIYCINGEIAVFSFYHITDIIRAQSVQTQKEPRRGTISLDQSRNFCFQTQRMMTVSFFVAFLKF